MSAPLAGVRVVDLGDEAVVFAARLLADLGADVIRIESLTGDEVRLRPPFVDDAPGLETGLAHILYNSGKRSVALALNRREGWQVAHRLLGQADVVIAPLERSDLAREFLAHDVMRAAMPRFALVDPVFRRSQPADVATDLVGTASGGLLWLNGEPSDPPNLPAGQLAFKQLSLAAAFAALTLLLDQREPPGPGAITVSMQEAVLWTTIQSANENYWYWHHHIPGRHGIDGLGGRTVYQARDHRWVSLYLHPPYWPNYVRWVEAALGEQGLSGPEWDDPGYRWQHHGTISAISEKLCLTLDRDALVEEGQRRQLLLVPVQDVGDIAADPHLHDRGFFQEAWFDQLGRSLQLARPPFLSSTYRAVAKPAPRLGEHTMEVLESNGFLPQEAAQLLRDGLALDPGGVVAGQ